MIYSGKAKKIILAEAKALDKLAQQIPDDFNTLVDYILNFKGRVILTGIGKSGYIARKIAASFSSTGTPAFFLHPTEASHGDLGMISANDILIMLSNSGESEELLNIIDYCKKFSVRVAVITMNTRSVIAQSSSFVLAIPRFEEVSTINAPTVSALAMLSLGDALTTCVHEARDFSKDDFKMYHPGGKIGRKLAKVEELMRTDEQLPLVYADTSFRDTIITMNEKCLGCALVVDRQKSLLGIITDGDLRRYINKDNIYIHKAIDIMTKDPKCTVPEIFGQEVLELMNNSSITNIPVVLNNKVVGIINIHDLLKAGID